MRNWNRIDQVKIIDKGISFEPTYEELKQKLTIQ